MPASCVPMGMASGRQKRSEPNKGIAEDCKLISGRTLSRLSQRTGALTKHSSDVVNELQRIQLQSKDSNVTKEDMRSEIAKVIAMVRFRLYLEVSLLIG